MRTMCLENVTLLSSKRELRSNYYYHLYLDISARELLIPESIIYSLVSASAQSDF